MIQMPNRTRVAKQFNEVNSQGFSSIVRLKESVDSQKLFNASNNSKKMFNYTAPFKYNSECKKQDSSPRFADVK